jgi:hypothetical protein
VACAHHASQMNICLLSAAESYSSKIHQVSR